MLTFTQNGRHPHPARNLRLAGHSGSLIMKLQSVYLTGYHPIVLNVLHALKYNANLHSFNIPWICFALIYSDCRIRITY